MITALASAAFIVAYAIAALMAAVIIANWRAR